MAEEQKKKGKSPLKKKRARPAPKKYLPFEEAREYVRSLGLVSKKEWREYKKLRRLPKGVPYLPEVAYKGKGWAGLVDWLGSDGRRKDFLSFEDAREYARSLKLKTSAEWFKHAKTPGFPANVPKYPIDTYEGKGWAGMGDWLGTGTIAPQLRKFRSFRQARRYARSLGLTIQKDWHRYAKDPGLPEDIPVNPLRTYEGKGWVDWFDWLGYEKRVPQQCRPFEEAREFARSLNFKSRQEWDDHRVAESLPEDIPASPGQAYKGKGWIGWGDWLGTGVVYHEGKKYRPFEEAREYARSLDLKNHRQWLDHTRDPKFPRTVPAAPNDVYKDKGWAGVADWLGVESVSVFRRKYRPFEEAREYARALGLTSRADWTNHTKLPGFPRNIPASPQEKYRDKGWSGWSDWIGTENAASKTGEFRPFEEARAYARSLGLIDAEEWVQYTRTYLPEDIPANPADAYEDKGWVSWRDWLGS